MRKKGRTQRDKKYPIEHWSHSSLLAYLRNPLAWYKRYVKKIYDTPRNPSAVVGSAGHKALEHFYSGADKETAIRLGLEYLRNIPDFEIEFGKAKSKKAQKAKRESMEREYLQAIGFYLERPPKHRVLGVETRGTVAVDGFALPLKAVADLVVESKGNPGHVDVVDHKFVDSFSKAGAKKTLFVLQALFNYHVAREVYGKPVHRFIVYECKKRKNADGSAQLKRYVLPYAELRGEFEVFRRLVNDASADLLARAHFLPNPSDMFEGEDSFDVYRLALAEEDDSESRRS